MRKSSYSDLLLTMFWQLSSIPRQFSKNVATSDWIWTNGSWELTKKYHDTFQFFLSQISRLHGRQTCNNHAARNHVRQRPDDCVVYRCTTTWSTWKVLNHLRAPVHPPVPVCSCLPMRCALTRVLKAASSLGFEIKVEGDKKEDGIHDDQQQWWARRIPVRTSPSCSSCSTTTSPTRSPSATSPAWLKSSDNLSSTRRSRKWSAKPSVTVRGFD